MNKTIKIRYWCALLAAGIATASAADAVTAQLARELSLEGDARAAALEYRRLALSMPEPDARGGYAWAAAYEYGRADDWDTALRLLAQAEREHPDLEHPVLLLRAEGAEQLRQYREAEFYFQILRDSRAAAEHQRRYAARRSAALLVRMDRADEAAAVLAAADPDHAAGQAALAAYARGRDKRPLVGGLLGIIPGLGYAYAGEYANAARSAILNGLFIFGMVHTARNDQWGAFAAITFFEVTWYSGSIYGGLDATHRYNRRRQEDCRTGIIGHAAYRPDFNKLPIVTLQFEF